MESKNIFSNRVKELRIAHSLTQSQLGEIIGLSKQAINDIEQGRRETTLSRATLLAQHFDVSIDYLVGRTGNPKINY